MDGDEKAVGRWAATLGRLREASWMDILGYVGMAYLGVLGAGGLVGMMSRH